MYAETSYRFNGKKSKKITKMTHFTTVVLSSCFTITFSYF